MVSPYSVETGEENYRLTRGSPNSVETGGENCRLAIPHDTERLQRDHRFVTEEGERQQKRKRKNIYCATFLVSLCIKIAVIIYLCSRKKTYTQNHSYQSSIDQNIESKTDTQDHSYQSSIQQKIESSIQAKMMSSYMDVTADPCQDFYQYACGNWGKVHPIPKHQTAYNTFTVLQEKLDDVLRKMLEEPPYDIFTFTWYSRIFQDDATTKAKDYFKSCMNNENEHVSEKPLLRLLQKLGGWPVLQPNWDSSEFDWVRLMANLALFDNDFLILEWVGRDIKNSDENITQFDQATLGLPSRDYYLQPSYAHYIQAYENYLIKIATLLGAPLDDATQQAKKFIKFETMLAKITLPPEQHQNFSETYQKMSIRELEQYVPQIDWTLYLSAVLDRTILDSEQVVVYALKYIQDLVVLLGKTPSRTIANYLMWRFVLGQATYLDDRFQDAKQQYYYVLYGREEPPPRWQNCIDQVNNNFGMAVGSMLVRKYYDKYSKNDIILMIKEIKQSFKELLTTIKWIDTATKKLVVRKLDAMLPLIGYLDFIFDPQSVNNIYKDLVIRPNQFFENTLNVLQHKRRTQHNILGTTINKLLGHEKLAAVGAYYNAIRNIVVFPAGILQPPFYHRYFPRGLNYGGIGFTIGHEITHGFDSMGRMFDKDANLKRWWPDKAEEGFRHHAQCLIDQYSNYTVQELAMNVDGKKTLNENIADNGGIKQAYKAYQRWAKANAHVSETLPGVDATGHQLFFLNFAQTWCGTVRHEMALQHMILDEHSPWKFRVIGTLSNSEDFASVFKCEPGTPMNPVKKCSVW